MVTQFTDVYFVKHQHDDVIKWKHFPRYWPFVRGIHRSPVNSPHKGQWRGALMFSLICVWINGWVNNREAGDLRRNQAHYDVIVMRLQSLNGRLKNSSRLESLDVKTSFLIIYHGDVTRASWHLKSPAIVLFVSQLVVDNNKKTTKASQYWLRVNSSLNLSK